MKLLILCSEKSNVFPKNELEIKTDSRFANTKFIPHLKDLKEACTVCGKECYWCRGYYDLDHSEDIVQIVSLPDVYPLLVDDPLTYLPPLENHDIAIALGIHQDILLELPRLIMEKGAKALIAPDETGKWISRWVREKLIEECNKYGLEYAFPKPFCSLDYGKFETVNAFIERYRVGKPRFVLYVDEEDTIVKTEVEISAPCGNGYNIAKHLVGKKLGEEAKLVVAKYWHSYPCMGGMTIDPEVGDTILHIGGYLHYSALENAKIVRVTSQTT